MRRVTLILVCAFIFVFALSNQTNAAVPQLINYQGVLTDSTGAGLETTVDIIFGIYENAVGLTPIWVEAHAGVIVTGGLFSVLLGSTTPLDVSIFGGPVRYLGITVGADPEIIPRTMLVTVPWAFRVGTVDGATGGNINGNLGVIFDPTVNSEKITVHPGLDAILVVSNNVAHNPKIAGTPGTIHVLDATATIVNIDLDGNQGDITALGNATFGPGHTNTGVNSFVAGQKNTVTGGTANTVSGGASNTAGAPGIDGASVGGGANNTAGGFASTVGGGSQNNAGGDLSTVGGGGGNGASVNNATVSGGFINSASGPNSTVGGGTDNSASGNSSTVGGGSANLAVGNFSTVPGGIANVALGVVSFAAGNRAKANHSGAFVWADGTTADFASTGTNQFNIRAAGGTRIYSDGALSTGVTLSAGGGAWVAVSDSAVKRNIRPVDEFDILEKVASLPISRWSYETQSPDIEHIGPMAQDFYATFGVGEDERGISTLDPDGVALAAIKALYKENKVLKEQIQMVQAESREEIRKLEKILKELLDSK